MRGGLQCGSWRVAVMEYENSRPSCCAFGRLLRLCRFFKRLTLLHTATTDNGKEFAGHKDFATALGIDVYFAHPYHSWKRGANENMNGLIRQYLPKGSSFEDLTDKDISFIQNRLNNRPRKKLGFLTPLEYFFR